MGAYFLMCVHRAGDIYLAVLYFSGGVGGFLAGLYLDIPVVTWTLIVLMVIDIIAGLGAAYVTGELNSDASFHGMVRKTLILLLVLACAVLARVLPGHLTIPAGSLASSFFCVHEFISIIENVQRAGVAPPESLRGLFERFRRPNQPKSFLPPKPAREDGKEHGSGSRDSA